MALNALGLGITLTAKDSMSGVLDCVGRAFSSMRGSSIAAASVVSAGLATMAAGVGAFAMGVAGLESAFGLAASAAAFTAAIQRAGMVAEGVRGQSASLSASLRDVAMSAAMATGFDPTQIANGLESIAAMGFNASQSIAMIRPALDLAAGGGITVASAASAMTSAIKVFGLAASDSGDVADKLKGIADFTGLEAKDLEIALGTVGRGAGMANQNLDEMLIMMGLVKNTGVDATVAASSVSSALIFMAKNAAKFEKIGVSVTDVSGKFRDMGDVVVDVGKAMATPGKNEAEAVKELTDLFQRFGVTAYQGVFNQLNNGMIDEETGKMVRLGDAMDYLRKRSAKSAEENRAREFADAMLNTFDGLSKRASATLEVLKTSIGEGFEALFKPLLRIVNSGIGAIAEIFMKMSPAAKKLGAGLYVAAAAMAMAAGTALIFAGAIALLGVAVIVAGAPLVLWLVAVAAAALPMVAVAMAVTAALALLGTGIGILVTNNIGGSADKIKATFERWKLIFQSVIGFLSEGKLTKTLAEEFMKADAETQKFIVKATLFFEKIKAFAQQFYDDVKVYMGGATPIIADLGTSLFDLGVALGIVDEKYLGVVETMDKSDFSTSGRKTAELFVSVFGRITRAITLAVDVLTFFINRWGEALTLIKWGTGYTPMKMLFGAMIDAGAGGGAMEDRPTGAMGGTGDRPSWQSGLTPEAFGAVGYNPEDVMSMPAADEAETKAVAAESSQAALLSALNDARRSEATRSKKLIVQSVLDSRVIAEAVMSIMDDNTVSSFSGGGTYASVDE